MIITTTQTKYRDGAIAVTVDMTPINDKIDLNIEYGEDEVIYVPSFLRHQLGALAAIFTEMAKREDEVQFAEVIEGSLLKK